MPDQIAAAFQSDPRVSRILDIVAVETATDRVALVADAKIDEIGISSLDLTMAVFKLETVFDIEIPVIADRAGNEFGTVGELVGHVLSVMDKAAAPARDEAAAMPAGA